MLECSLIHRMQYSTDPVAFRLMHISYKLIDTASKVLGTLIRLRVATRTTSDLSRCDVTHLSPYPVNRNRSSEPHITTLGQKQIL